MERQAYRQNVQSEQRGGRGEEQILRAFAHSLSDMERSLFKLYLTNLSYQKLQALISKDADYPSYRQH